MGSILAWIESWFTSKTSVPGSIIADIQAATVQFCNFLPLAESVEALVLASNPQVVTTVAVVEPIAKSICAVVSKAPPVAAKAFISAQPVSWDVNGVAVQGRWVR